MTRVNSVVLIQTPCPELQDDRLEPPLGLLYLAGWLRQNGVSVCVIDLTSIPPQQWANYIPRAEVYGFSTYTTSYHRTLEILKIAKTIEPMAWTVAGGPHASALPESVARDFDFVVVGEGETALLHLVQALEHRRSLPAIWQEPPIADLDTLPFPDYTLVDVHSYHRIVDGQPSLSILSSRGCPYRCLFCNSIVMKKYRDVRFRSAANVAEEIRWIKAEWGIASLRFQDDIFTLNLPRLRAMTPLLHDAGITYRCFGRVDRCCPETAVLLYEGGCRHIAFGVESGSDAILTKMHKDQTAADIRQGIANAKAAGLVVRVYLVVGFPGETWQTIQETVTLMQECGPDEFSVYPLIPYPGTPLYQQPEAFGITTVNPDFAQYFQISGQRGTGYVFRTSDLDEHLVADMRQYVIEQVSRVAIWAGDSKAYK